MKKNLPANITFQWHITGQCNFRCKHCYQDAYSELGVSHKDQLYILNQLVDFARNCQKEHDRVRAHINFTGGEPFVRKDFLQLLKAVKETGLFSFSILSNGYLLDDFKLKQLKELAPRFVQISLEGSRKTNDEIRGEGSYLKITKAIKVYQKLQIPVMISFTANAANYIEFPKVVTIARRYGAFKVWTDRYLPSSNNDPLQMSTHQVKDFFHIIKSEQKKSKYHLLSKTQISSSRALQFLVSGDRPYQCSAGKTLLAILPQGDLLPCRRLPIKVGNTLIDDLVELYLTNSVLQDIRKPIEDNGCSACYYKQTCAGGLRCLSYAVNQNYKIKDPNCWI